MALYIAETNGVGKVVHVWVQDIPSHPARPVSDRAPHVDLVMRSDVSGAPREEIQAWLRA